MQVATTEVLYFETGPGNAPTLRVRPGEVFAVQTQLNRGPWLEDHPDGERLRRLLRGGNPASGCIHVEGAEPGMVLTVHVGPIRLDSIGFTRFWGANGALPGYLGGTGVGEQARVVEIREGLIHWGDGRTLPVAPMLVDAPGRGDLAAASSARARPSRPGRTSGPACMAGTSTCRS